MQNFMVVVVLVTVAVAVKVKYLIVMVVVVYVQNLMVVFVLELQNFVAAVVVVGQILQNNYSFTNHVKN